MADNLKELTADIVASYVENNRISEADLPGLIKTVYASLSGVETPAEPEVEPVFKPTPAQIKKSITPEKLISFIDGKSYSLLKRHLTLHGLTPAAYRERFGLPSSYPIVAPNYAARRSELAVKAGLGRKAAPEAIAPALTPAEPIQAPEAVTADPKAAKAAAKSANAPKTAKATPVGEKAGPGASVPKAVRSPKAINPAEDEFT